MKYVRTEKGIEKLTDEQYNERFPKPAKTYLDLRKEAYGSVEKQIEYIVENGLESWQTRVQEIKTQFPKE